VRTFLRPAACRDGSIVGSIVYTVARFRVELADDSETRILTLETPDGFSVSLGLTEEQCREIAIDRRSEFPNGTLTN
jgi:hypothetical protein